MMGMEITLMPGVTAEETQGQNALGIQRGHAPTDGGTRGGLREGTLCTGAEGWCVCFLLLP